MNTTAKPPLQHWRAPVQMKLAALWASIMSCYIYGDFWGLFRPGNLAGMLHGDGPLGPTSQGSLLAVAVLVAVPAAMIFLSLVLAPAVNRWANILLATSLTIIVAITLPGAWAFYVLLSAIEMALQSMIVWYAWRWPTTAPE